MTHVRIVGARLAPEQIESMPSNEVSFRTADLRAARGFVHHVTMAWAFTCCLSQKLGVSYEQRRRTPRCAPSARSHCLEGHYLQA
jgi:hypothetical protein